MDIKKLTLGLAVLLALLGASATAHSAPFGFRGSGSFAALDPENPASQALFNITGTGHPTGPLNINAVLRFTSFGAPTAACPGGTASGPVGASVGRAPDGSLLYGRFTGGTACFGLTITIDVTGEFTGGTGRFATANGAFDVQVTATPLTIDFGSAEAIAEGTLNK